MESISGLPQGIEPIRVARQVGRNWSMIFGVHGAVDERTLRDTAEELRDRISLLDGGANTIVVGVRRPEVSIEVSESSMQAYGLTFDEVARAVRAGSINAGAGAVRTADGNFMLQARQLADTQRDFENLIVRQTADGGVVRVRDVAQVIDGFQDTNLYSRMNGEPSALVSLQNADRFNIWKTAEAVEETLTEFRSTLPPGVQVTTIYNESEDYNALLGVLFQNAAQGFFLIFVLLLLTLHPAVAAWATLGVITAFAGSFFILPYVDVSLNFMSVFGFLLVLGIMVDDAIIVGEAVYERAERGHSGVDSTIAAVQLVLKPLMASVFVTMISFSPMILIEGDAQQFTRAISIVVMSTLVFSLIEIFDHSSRPPRACEAAGPTGAWLFQPLDADSATLRPFRALGSAPRSRPAGAGRRQAALPDLGDLCRHHDPCRCLMASGRIKQTFMPEVEGDFLQASITLPQTAPFSRMEQVAEQLDAARRALEAETGDVAQEDPNTGHLSRGVVRSWSQSIDENRIQAWVGLTPPETRPHLRSKQITERLEELLGEVPDAEEISISLSGNGSPKLEFAILSENKDDLREASEDLRQRLLRFSAITSVRDSEEAANEELRFSMLPGAQQLGVTLGDVTRQVRQAYFGEEVQRLPREGDDVRVYVRYPRDDRRTLESLGNFRVRTADGREVPLATVANWEFAPGVVGLDRRQRQSTITVTADLVNAEARTDIMRTLDREYFPGFEARFASVSRRAIGEAEGQQEFMNQLLVLMGLAFCGIYFLLAVTFRSYAQPAMILCVIPFAIVGATLGHLVFGISFALFSWLGVIAAIGVVVNDNVVLVDRCNQIRGYFAMRLKQDGAAPIPADAGWAPHELTAPDGNVYELVSIQEDHEIHDEYVLEGLASNFLRGPIELRASSQMNWEKSEYRERSEELEHAGFQVMRVTAERGIVDASISRFRQIFLTSVTEFVGTSPMLLENATIVQFLKPMVLSLAFGVLLCMPATLLLTPAFYMIGVDIKRVAGGAFRGAGKLVGFYARLYGRREKPVAAE